MPDPEIILWSKVRTGDKQAFGELFHNYYPVLCLLSKRYTHDMTTAREVVQDIFIYLWEHRQELEITTSVKSYLAQAVRYNSIRRHDSDRKARVLVVVIPEPVNTNEFHDHLEYAELQNSILKAVESLPEQCHNVFSMSRFEKMSYREIANSLNISVKTVEAHISKALRMIQKHLDTIELLLLILLTGEYL